MAKLVLQIYNADTDKGFSLSKAKIFPSLKFWLNLEQSQEIYKKTLKRSRKINMED